MLVLWLGMQFMRRREADRQEKTVAAWPIGPNLAGLSWAGFPHHYRFGYDLGGPKVLVDHRWAPDTQSAKRPNPAKWPSSQVPKVTQDLPNPQQAACHAASHHSTATHQLRLASPRCTVPSARTRAPPSAIPHALKVPKAQRSEALTPGAHNNGEAYFCKICANL